MCMDNLRDTLSGERLLSEPPLDVVQDLSMRRVGLVKKILKSKVCRAKTIAEMLGEDPATVYRGRRQFIRYR